MADGARSGEQSKEDGYGPWGRRTGPLTSRTGNLLFRRYITRAYRCAKRRFPRSPPTVDGKVKCCLVGDDMHAPSGGEAIRRCRASFTALAPALMSLGSQPALTCTDSYCAQPTPYQEPSGPSGRRTRLSRARLGKATGVPRGADDPQGPNRPGAGGFARRPPGRSSWGSSLSRPKFGPSSPGAHARIDLPRGAA